MLLLLLLACYCVVIVTASMLLCCYCPSWVVGVDNFGDAVSLRWIVGRCLVVDAVISQPR